MRYSNTAVEQFHLTRLVDGIAEGRIGIPEFQRDFDWNENDIRSLLATVFAGWPAGSLLLLEGKSELFALRPMEAAPKLDRVVFGVLDGQQRLTSLYQALYGVGEAIYAIRWDLSSDQEIEEGIVSIRRSVWERHRSTIGDQVKHRLIPLAALRTPTTFFSWRDDALASIADDERRSLTKEVITNLYTYRLSALHDYEFPVVKLDRDIAPSAISRIFEKVNKTGLTLNTFDLVVAKSFDPGWNLRDRWLTAREKFGNLSTFFGEDGLPLLQAVSLLARGDLRQAAVLELSKQDVQKLWEEVVYAASSVIDFLSEHCGVLRRDFMPYFNMLPPLIALEVEGRVSARPKLFSYWFWLAGFTGMYEVGANTLLVSHYRNLRDEAIAPVTDEEDVRVISFVSATRKSQKALWSTVNCAYVYSIEQSRKLPVSEELIAEIDFGSLFSLAQVKSSFRPGDETADTEFRSCLNTVLIPSRLASVSRKLGARETVELCRASEMGDVIDQQLVDHAADDLRVWAEFRADKTDWLIDFMRKRDIEGQNILRVGEDNKYEIIEI